MNEIINTNCFFKTISQTESYRVSSQKLLPWKLFENADLSNIKINITIKSELEVLGNILKNGC